MIFLFFLLVAYAALVVMLTIGWKKATTVKHDTTSAKGRPSPEGSGLPFISVLVAARNEAHNIPALLESLINQEYTSYEIIIIDDHSEDNLAGAVSVLNGPKIRIVRNAGIGKKNAITTGVGEAQGAVIATTDADSIVPSAWLKRIGENFSNDQTRFLFGPVAIRDDGSFFSGLQEMEFASVIGTGGAAAAYGMPLMCNGANLAYRKSDFARLGGYAGNRHVASGDDEFLLRKFIAAFRSKDAIRFMGEKAAIVYTQAQPDITSFISQRVRWASKWKGNASTVARLLAPFMLVCQVAFLWSCFHLVMTPSLLTAIAVAAKIFSEAIFLLGVSRFLTVKFRWIAFVLLQLLYPIYIVVIGLCSLWLSPTWKGRKT